jgi:signal transduction histidine kinase
MIIMRAAVLLMVLLALLYGYEFFGSVLLKMKKPLSAALLVLTLLTTALSSYCCEAYKDDNIGISPAIMMSLAAALTAAGLVLLRKIEKWKASQLSAVSVKECVDTLPTGICFYNENGMPVLTNTVMENICRELLGVYLSDGRALWETVAENTELSDVLGKSGPIVQLSDGKVYGFTRYEADIEGRKFFELIASDMTSEYTLTQELREKEAHADSINRRLHDLNRSIGEVIKERELLQIKKSIHDGFGQMLLLTKRSLLVPGSVDHDELLRLWKRNTMLLSNVQSAQNDTPYSSSIRHAEKLGVNVKISGGELPTETHVVDIIDEAITVHVTNVLRHAHGSTAFIDVRSTGSTCELRFTNDGIQNGNIRERGGLLNLRRLAESCGGSMEIRNGEHFELILRLPLNKGDTQNGI